MYDTKANFTMLIKPKLYYYRIAGNFRREKFLEISEKSNSKNIFPNILCSYI